MSRSASRSASRSGQHRREEGDGEEEEEESLFGEGWMSSESSRRSSLNLGPFSMGGGGGALGLETMTEGEIVDVEREGEAAEEEEEDDEEGGTTFKESGQWGDHLNSTTPSTNTNHLLSSHRSERGRAPRYVVSPETPRVYSTEMDEEPYLETAPSSPLPQSNQARLCSITTSYSPPLMEKRRTSTHDSFANGLEDVDVFDEGERVGVGVYLEGRGGWARDCFEGTEDVGKGAGSVLGELEVVRRLGEGTYAM